MKVIEYSFRVLEAYTRPQTLLPPCSLSRGTGAGAVRLDVFPEPYTGRLLGNDAPVVMLGLDPGGALPQFQAHGGHFVKQLEATSYHEWASTVPYASTLWESVHGKNRFYRNRFAFARRLLDRPDWPANDGVFFELYPYHSSRVTASMRPPVQVIREFVFDPVGDLDTEFVFAFGKPWFSVAEGLGLPNGRELAVQWSAPGRQARVHELPSGQSLVVMAQTGYAGPPGATDTQALANALGLS